MNIYDYVYFHQFVLVCGRCLEICCFVQVTAASDTRDLDEKSAEVEFYYHAQSYSDYLDFKSRNREKPSFRINEWSLAAKDTP